jgi:hypothetical protein
VNILIEANANPADRFLWGGNGKEGGRVLAADNFKE